MTGTKVVKLKLEGGGGLAERLPELRDTLVEKAMIAYGGLAYDRNYQLFYPPLLESLRDFDVMPKELQAISDRLREVYSGQNGFSEIAGMFLTALVQNSNTSEFKLKLKSPLNLIGIGLSKGKDLTVEGDVGELLGAFMEGAKIHVTGKAGDLVGRSMEKGTIKVDGDAGNQAGLHMENGTIEIGGNTGYALGDGMRAGSITVGGNTGNELGLAMQWGYIKVEGDAGDMIGEFMEGGTIEINGKMGKIHSEYKDGVIIHQGRQVRPKKKT
ncbi:MAG: hypothetical protein V1921_06485 [Candidatus Altiarchaeota archaeon]